MKDNFDLNLEIDLAAEEICSGIVSERKRKRVIEEIKAHFEDSVYQKTLDGNCPEDAFGITYKEFCNGDSREIRRLLARTHNVFSSEAQKKIVYYLSPLVIFPAFFQTAYVGKSRFNPQNDVGFFVFKGRNICPACMEELKK